ncbi:hypothetical protein RFN58_34620 [Streptomyces iakyrus]|uniref:hypothetical protein n=1 Tax=Streptomyces iakyrus TaxID=68219 RepID=UPI000691A2AA|nr:hypothetical protein [Streptomyces iakyrus]
MIRQRVVLAAAAGVTSALLLTACGSSGDSSSGTDSGAAAASSAPASSAPAGSGDADGMGMATTSMLMTEEMEGMGTFVTDDKGMTLYRYEMDQASPSKSMCTGDCAKTWMPVMAQDSVKAMGVEQSLVGSVDRSDGMKQLTLAGRPLYRYMGDAKAGELKGQAKDSKWYAVTPAGEKAAMSSDGSGSSDGTSGGSGSSDDMEGMPGMS